MDDGNGALCGFPVFPSTGSSTVATGVLTGLPIGPVTNLVCDPGLKAPVRSVGRGNAVPIGGRDTFHPSALSPGFTAGVTAGVPVHCKSTGCYPFRDTRAAEEKEIIIFLE